MSKNYDLRILADLTEASSWKFTFAKLCHRLGLLQFRSIRHLFFDDAKIATIYYRWRAQSENLPELTKTWEQMGAHWSLNLPPHHQAAAASLKKVDLFKTQAFKKEPFEKAPIHLHSTGYRTAKMKDHLKNFNNYDSTNQILPINGIDHQVVSSATTQFADNLLPLVSCGASKSREFVLFDPKNSPILQRRYRKLFKILDAHIQQTKSRLSPEDLLSLTMSYMKSSVFPSSRHLDSKMKKLLDTAKRDDDAQQYLPIDLFLDKKLGVCRHHALVAAYFLDRFIQHHPEKCTFIGKVQVMRDDIKGGAHAWLTLVCSGDKTFCFDSLNGIQGNLANKEFHEMLSKDFGSPAVKHQGEKAFLLRLRHSIS